MEHRRRTFSNVLDDDIEMQKIKKNSISIDEHIDNYTEYVYNGTFSISNFIFCGILKLICPFCFKKREPIIIN
jgi:hypothetical protein